MRTSPSRLALACLIVAISAGTAGRSIAARDLAQNRGAQSRAARAHALIDDFDECLQQRFKDVDEGFGFRRIVKAGETPHRFKPENAREEGAVRDLEREGLRVVLYLAGRRVLGVADRAQTNGAAPVVVPFGTVPGSLIHGPVTVTTNRRESDLSAVPPLDLRDESRRAMMTFDRASSYDFTAGAWTFVAHPVRASEESCVRCHDADGTTRLTPVHDRVPSLRVGDPLGVLLYGYQFIR